MTCFSGHPPKSVAVARDRHRRLSPNVRQALRQFGVRCAEHGEAKNVSRGWVGIVCPWCGDSDYHAAVNEATGAFSCFKCHAPGGLLDVLSQVSGQSRTAVERSLDTGRVTYQEPASQALRRRHSQPVATPTTPADCEFPLPNHCINLKQLEEHDCHTMLSRFLVKRRYSCEFLTERNCLVCVAGEYKFRLVIPIRQAGRPDGWQARDLTDQAWEKFRFPPGFNAGQYLYGLSELQGQTAYLTEGVFDQWRLSPSARALCTFGTHVTPTQAKTLVDAGVREIVLCWDPDTFGRKRVIDGRIAAVPSPTRMTARDLRALFSVRVAHFPDTDTGEKSDPDALGYERSMNVITEARVL